MASDQMSLSSTTTYRRDIDGMRGLAVLLVVLFHATGSVRGGFIGVDSFFVISGYLITGILLREMDANTFTLAAFWERRIRRILPAAFVMAVVTLGLSFLVLLPDDLMGMGRSLVAHALMVSNIYFWQDSGYFAAASDQKPLLHTWSLAVEEQFYLVFPLLCLIIKKWCASRSPNACLRTSFLKVFTTLMLFSFVVSVWMVKLDPSAGFYLLPSRAWELLVGSTLACFPVSWLQSPPQLRRGIATLGALMILIPAFQLRDTMPFPGFLALPPCLGAAMLIWAHSSAQVSISHFWLTKILESRFFVGLGVISYSLYLWHWPFLAFWEYLDVSFSKSVSHIARLVLVLVALGLAFASWRWIETPFRKKGGILANPRAVFMTAGFCFASFIGLGWFVDAIQGMPKRWPDTAINYAEAAHQMGIDQHGKGNSLEAVLNQTPPSFGSDQVSASPHVLVWGDSHAMCISPALEALCKQKGLRGYLTSYSSTPPLLNFVQPGTNGLSAKGPIWARGVLEIVRSQKIPNLIMVGYWQQYTKGREAECLAALKETIHQFSEAGAKVWIVLDVPNHEMMVPRALALHVVAPSLFPDPKLLASTVNDHQLANAAMNAFASELTKSGATILDPARLLLGDDAKYRVVDGAKCLYSDVGHHLSIDGALSLIPLFEPVFTGAQSHSKQTP